MEVQQSSTVSCPFLHGNYTYKYNIIQQLDEVKPDGSLNEALKQVGLADVILINKIDLVSKEQLAAIRQRIRSGGDQWWARSTRSSGELLFVKMLL